ncbi:MAG TPA: hypothetical protein VF173_12430 [Thermoanaerobaculia bacterium]|nr:hypothetical protein [Thermoanaerobaculia bacterium]
MLSSYRGEIAFKVPQVSKRCQKLGAGRSLRAIRPGAGTFNGEVKEKDTEVPDYSVGLSLGEVEEEGLPESLVLLPEGWVDAGNGG